MPRSAAVRTHRAIALRQTDSRSLRDSSVTLDTIDALSAVAEAHGAYLRPVGPPRAGVWSLILAARSETPLAWLRAGEAYSAVSLSVAAEGLVVASDPDRMSFEQLSAAYDGPGRPLVALTVDRRR